MRITNKTVVYTAIFGKKDGLRIPEIMNKEIDYVCFTDDKKLQSSFWDVRYIENPELVKGIEINLKNYPSRMKAKVYKVLPHLFFPEYRYSVWVDGNVRPIKDMNLLINKYLKKHNIAMFNHGRNCIYEEMDACIKYKKDTAEIINKQRKKYKEIGYPENNGLVTNAIMFRRHNNIKVIQTMKTWWEEIQQESSRDQLSLMYCMWEHGLKYRVIHGDRWRGSEFSTKGHKKKR